MKKILLSLLILISLASCSNHGKKIKVEGTKGEVYYKGDGVTEDDAKKVGKFLKEQSFFSTDRGASVQVTKDGEEYILRFVYDKSVYDTLKGVDNAFKTIAVKASKELFGGKKVNIALASKTFKDFKTISYDEAFAKSMDEPAPLNDNPVTDDPLGDDPSIDVTTLTKDDFDHDKAGGVDFFWRGITDQESKTIAEYIVENGAFADGTAEIYMTKEKGRYILRFPVIESARDNPAFHAELDKVTKQIKDNVFANVPYTFHMTDERLRSVKAWDY